LICTRQGSNLQPCDPKSQNTAIAGLPSQAKRQSNSPGRKAKPGLSEIALKSAP
jgi:hypothetical protein